MNLGLLQHFSNKIGAQFCSGSEIHLATKYLGQLALHPRHAEEADLSLGKKLDQNIKVGIGAKVISNDRAKEGEPLDLVLAAEGIDGFDVVG